MDTKNLVDSYSGNIFNIQQQYYLLSVNGDGWSCTFKMSPQIGISVSGDKPEEIDFIHAMQSVNIPVWAVQALYVAACMAFDANNSAAIAAGLTAGELYKTTTGEARFVV